MKMASKQEGSVVRPRTIYQCNECGKVFPAYAKLINHERIHTGEKPFVCRICCRAFTQETHLKRHHKVHDNQRPHECAFCDRAFKHKAHLKRHTKSHHSYSYQMSQRDKSDSHDPEKLHYQSNELLNAQTSANREPLTHLGKHATKSHSNYKIGGTGESESHDPETLISKTDKSYSHDPEKLHLVYQSNVLLNAQTSANRETLTQMEKHANKSHNTSKIGETDESDSHDPEKLHYQSDELLNGKISPNGEPLTYLEEHTKIIGATGESDFQHPEKLKHQSEELLNGKTIPNVERLNGHVEGIYECQLCSKMFKRKSNLLTHEKNHAENKVFRCDLCGQAFPELQELAFHRTLCEERYYKCQICDKECGTKFKLKCHIETHSNDKSHICEICGTKFKHARSLTTHKRMHTGENNSNCEFCGKVFIRPNDLVVHRRTHTGERPYECNICRRAFKQKAHVEKHKETIHGKTNNNTTSSRVRNHNTKLRSKSEGGPNKIEISAEASDTDAMFAAQNGTHYTKLRNRSEKSPSEISGAILCTDDKFAAQNGTYVEDLTSLETELKPETCPEETSLSTYTPLPRQNTCETCGKSFTQKSYLVVHRRIHTGEMPYDCDICGQAFRQRAHMVKHKKSIHNVDKLSKQDNRKISPNAVAPLENDSSTSIKAANEHETYGETFAKVDNHMRNNNNNTIPQDEHLVFEKQNGYDELKKISKRRPFQCDVCHKKFRQRSYLNIHRRIHTGIMPFKCNICNRSFRQKTHVVKHKRTIHKLKKLRTIQQMEDHENETENHPDASQDENNETSQDESNEMSQDENDETSQDKSNETSQDGNMEKNTTNEIFTSEYSMVGDQIFERYGTESTSISETAHLDTLKCDDSSSTGKLSNTSTNCDQSESPDRPSNVSIDKPHACEICGKAFKRKHYLAIHKRMHTGERPYPCMVCTKSFRQDCHLRVHMSKVHPDEHIIMLSREPTTYKCEFCDRVYKRIHLLKQHEISHGVEQKPSIKPSSARNPQTLPTNHGKSLNKPLTMRNPEPQTPPINRGKPFTCQFCPKTFKLKQHLTSHERVHTGARPFVCSICNRAFKQSSHLTRHMKMHNMGKKLSERDVFAPAPTDDKPYKCRTCTKTFKSKKGQLYHIAKCNSTATKCKSRKGRSFVKTSIENNVNKPHECKECGKQFDRKQILVIHERVHSGDRPYQCEVCSKRFPIAGNLARHKIIHTGQKPYICYICDKGCTQKSNMEAHIRLVHKVKREEQEEFSNCQRKKNKKKSHRSRSTNNIAKRKKEGKSDDNITEIHRNNYNDMATINRIVQYGLSIKEETKDSDDEIYRCCECGRGFDEESSMMDHCMEVH